MSDGASSGPMTGTLPDDLSIVIGREQGVPLPDGRYLELPGQTHMVKAGVAGPAIAEFLAG